MIGFTGCTTRTWTIVERAIVGVASTHLSGKSLTQDLDPDFLNHVLAVYDQNGALLGAVRDLKIVSGASGTLDGDTLNLSTTGGVIKNNGVVKPSEPGINFGTDFSVTDNPGAGDTDVALGTTGVSANTYGTAGDVPQLTVDAKGRITGVTNVPIVVPGFENPMTQPGDMIVGGTGGAATVTHVGTTGQGLIAEVGAPYLNAPTAPILSTLPTGGTAGTNLVAPAAPGLSTNPSGGSISSGTYKVEVTYTNPTGETVGSAFSSVTISGSSYEIIITSPSASGNATAWNAYVTQAGGSVYTLQNGSPLAIGTNLTLGVVSTGGVNPPGSNTAWLPYNVEVTYINAQGETVASAASAVTPTTTSSTITIDSPAASGSGQQIATGWYAYASQAGGNTYTRQQSPGSPTSIGTALILTSNPTNTGANPPVSNTAASVVPTWSGVIGPGSAAGGVLTGTYPDPSGLTASGVSAGTYGDVSNIPQVTVGPDGRITSIADIAISGGGFANPMSQPGDIITGGDTGVPQATHAGSVGAELEMVSGAPYLSAPAAPTVNQSSVGGAVGAVLAPPHLPTVTSTAGGGSGWTTWPAPTAAPTVHISSTGGTIPAGSYDIAITNGSSGNFGETTLSPITTITLSGSTSSFTIDSPPNLYPEDAGTYFAYGAVAGSGVWYNLESGTSNGVGQTYGFPYSVVNPITWGGGSPYHPTSNTAILGFFFHTTYVNPAGETAIDEPVYSTWPQIQQQWPASATDSLVVTSPPASGDATGYYVYISAAADPTTWYQVQNGSPTPIGTNLTITTPVTVGPGLPSANTAFLPYGVEVSYVNAQGETTVSAAQTITTASTTSQLTVVSPPAAGAGNQAATGWYAYVTQPSGGTYYRQQLAGSPTAIGTDLTITTPPTTYGATPPVSNTAGSLVPTWSQIMTQPGDLLTGGTSGVGQRVGISSTVGQTLSVQTGAPYLSAPNAPSITLTGTGGTVGTQLSTAPAWDGPYENGSGGEGVAVNMPPPSAPVAVPLNDGLGTIATGTYQVVVTYSGAYVNSFESTPSSATVVNVGSNSNRIQVTHPASDTAVNFYTVYMTQAGGSIFYKISSASIGVNYTISSAPAGTEAQPPTVNECWKPYFSYVTYVDPNGNESSPSSKGWHVVSGSYKYYVIPTPATISGAVGYYAYMSQVDQISGPFYRQQVAGSPMALGTDYIVATTPTTSGATLPSSPTAYLPYGIEITYVNAQGETMPGQSITVYPTTGTSQITIDSPPAAGSGPQAATGWYAYVTQAGGSAYTRQQGSPTAIGTPFTLTAQPTSTGATPPVSNTAASLIPVWTDTNATKIQGRAVDTTAPIEGATFAWDVANSRYAVKRAVVYSSLTNPNTPDLIFTAAGDVIMCPDTA